MTSVHDQQDDAPAGLLSETRLRRWSGLFLAAQLAGAAFVVAGAYGLIVPLQRGVTTDFVSFYAAGQIAASPRPAQVYDRAAHFKAEQRATSPSIGYVHFFYPPVYLLLCRLLAFAPYLPAFFAFELATTVLYLASLRAIFGAWHPRWLLPVLSFGPLLWNFGFGQNACLTAALFGAGCLLLQRGRQAASGLVLSLLIYKPHTGLLIPLALLAGRHYRAFIAAVTGVALSVAATILLFGVAPWLRFFAVLFHSGGEFAHGAVTPYGNMVNLAAALRDQGVGAHAAMLAQGALFAAVAAAVIFVWRTRPVRDGSRYAALASGAVLAMPVVLFYDLVLLTAAAAFLLAHHKALRPWQQIALASSWLLGTLAYPLDRAWHAPAGLVAAVLVFAASVYGTEDYPSHFVKLFKASLAGNVRRRPGLAGWSAKIRVDPK
jgi:alpha-1,2-mannosyltransferase